MTGGDPTGWNRRETLHAMGATAVAGLAGCTTSTDTPKVTPDPADAAPTGPAIDTVVILMMENRSFDHYFGALSIEEGRTDVDGLAPGMSNPDADGEAIEVFRMHHDCLEDPPHGWTSSHDQFGDGANDGFVRAHQDGRSEIAQEVMGYYGRDELPIFYALADDNAVCQRWFASVMSSTWPNRIYGYCGTSDGMKTNDFGRIPFEMKSIFEQLDEAGVSWHVYVHEVPFVALLDGFGYQGSDERISLIDRFYEDAANGDLPEVVFVEPGYTFNDDHPPHSVTLGQVFVGSVYRALAESPHWERSMMVVTYDEHGGFFDHVAPPTVPDDHADLGFDQLGFRVPALVLGPYAKAEVIDTVFDHTSTLSHLQAMHEMPPLTLRNEHANDLFSCLDQDRMARREPRPPTELPTLEVSREDVDSACFYSLMLPGQVELEEAVEKGLIPEKYDFRDRGRASFEAVMRHAQRLGVVRYTDGF